MDFVHLRMRAGYDTHARSDGGTIALRSDQFNLDPVLLVAAVVAEQGRDVTHVQDEHIHIAIVVKVARAIIPDCQYRRWRRYTRYE